LLQKYLQQNQLSASMALLIHLDLSEQSKSGKWPATVLAP